MRKIVLSFLTLCTFIGSVSADETVQIVPQQIVAGSQEGVYENSFSIEMVNDDNVYTALQFDLYLPEGVEIDEYGIELNPDRFPNKIVKKQIVFEHEVTYAKRAEGFYRISIYGSNTNPSIDGKSGSICDIYYTSHDVLPEGILPVRIDGIVLAISGTEGVKAAANSSFLYSNDTSFETLGNIDLTGLDGITTQDVSAATRSLMSSPNSLLYLNEGSAAEGLQNVVVGNQCENLVLTDAEPFFAPKAFTAANASYTRTLSNDGWYSLCLPFAADIPAGVSVECFDRVDTDNAVVYFVDGTVKADKPCIFNAKAGAVEFRAANVEIADTPESLSEGEFFGTYSLLPAGTITGSYALFADGSGFGKAGETAYTQPFRAIVKATSQSPKLAIRHDNGDSATAITEVRGEENEVQRYNLAGQSVTNDHKGVVIKNKKTIVIK